MHVKLQTFVIPILLLAGCGGAQHGAAARPIPLGQARAVEIFEEAVEAGDHGQSSRNVAATLVNDTAVNVDVLASTLGAGFLFLNEEDVRSAGPIPEQAEGSELHAVLGRLEPGGQAHLLVLSDTDYTYLANPRADQRRPDQATLAEVEARLRRDALDFLQAMVDIRGGRQEPAATP